jgi:multidrug transporter EmrE-like cation transporter
MYEYQFLLVIVMFIVITETVAIACVKEFHNSSNYAYFILAILLYAVVCLLLDQSFNHRGMGVVNVIWSGLSVFLVAVFGVLFFKEKVHMHDIFAGVCITSGILIFKYTD